MPYKIFPVDDEYCVYKHDANGNKVGKPLGCHPSRAEAKAQLRALYANEVSKMDSIEKAKSLDEKTSDVWRGISEMLDNMWWIVKIFDDYLIMYYNGKHYQVSYTYNDNEEISFSSQSEWKEVEQEWVAKAMQDSYAIAKVNEDTEKIEEECDNCDKAEDIEVSMSFIAKSDKKQITYSVVYEPNDLDSQGDWADSEEIEKMAHNFLKNHLIEVRPAADLQHQEELPLEKAIPVESYIAPVDFNINNQLIKKGSWVLAMHIPDQPTWELVEKGEITGYSFRGKGLRIPADL